VTILLDANVLIALVVADHVHHAAAETWLGDGDFSFATCPTTEGSLVRLLVREGQSGAVAASVLTALAEHERHVFWPDDIAYGQADLRSVMGHRQVIDAYLASLARFRQGRLATFDRGLAATHPDVADLVEAG
jgi:uncharacterized protein